MIDAVYLPTPWRVPRTEWVKNIIESSYTSGKRPKEIIQTRVAFGKATEELRRRCQMPREEAEELAQKLEECDSKYRTF